MLDLETGVDNYFDAWHLCCMERKNIVLSCSFCHGYRQGWGVGGLIFRLQLRLLGI